MTITQEIKRLLGRSWSSYAELRGAIRHVIGDEIFFDCFEADDTERFVTIRRTAIDGETVESFEFTVELVATEVAVAA